MPEVTADADVVAVVARRTTPAQAHAYVGLANEHRPVPVSSLLAGIVWTIPRQECGAYDCGQAWPCDVRRALDIIDALAGVVD